MTELPRGWERARLADVAEVRLGRQRSPKNATGDRMRPYLRAANVKWGGLDLSDVNEMAFTEAESETYELRPGDLLLGEASGSPSEVGKPGQYKGEIDGCCFQNTLLRVRVPDALLPDFYEHYFREQALNGRFAAGSRGVGIHHLGAAALSDWPVPIPPTAEQERIVAAIEEAFSKLDAGEAGLRTVRQRLKRMREAVLAAAVTGRLVPQDPTDTPATKLLADLGVRDLGAAELEVLPDGWSWAALDSLNDPARPICYGILKPGANTPDGVPYVEVRSLRTGRIDPVTLPRSHSDIEKAFARSRLQPGDITIAIRGTTGRVAIVPPALVGGNVSRDCARLAVIGVNPHYVQLYLRGPIAQRFFAARVRGVAVKGINIGDLRRLPVALPPKDEQTRIVAEVDRQLSFIEACERAVDVGLARSAALRRSVLKSAFEGRLVQQDPSDEPASVLLDRIRAARAATAGKPKGIRARKVRS
ncbi:MAG: restriction endonuclease subunit S [Geodermatophilaceae bacterium]|nr:restriction endonuclease subunit S [Geodermatophilaceae bacterium]